MRLGELDGDELYLLQQDIPPDAWQVVSVDSIGIADYGDFLSLQEALQKYFDVLTDNSTAYTEVFFLPVWNTSWHEEILKARTANRLSSL